MAGSNLAFVSAETFIVIGAPWTAVPNISA